MLARNRSGEDMDMTLYVHTMQLLLHHFILTVFNGKLEIAHFNARYTIDFVQLICDLTKDVMLCVQT